MDGMGRIAANRDDGNFRLQVDLKGINVGRFSVLAS